MCASENMGRVSRARRIYEDIILRSGGGVSELRVVVGVCSTTTELDSRLIYILHSASTNTLEKEGRKRTLWAINSFGRGQKKESISLLLLFRKKKDHTTPFCNTLNTWKRQIFFVCACVSIDIFIAIFIAIFVFFPLKKEQKKGESTAPKKKKRRRTIFFDSKNKAKEKKRDKKREWEKEEKDTFIITLFFFSSG